MKTKIMPKQITVPAGVKTLMPLTAALPTLDKYWALENGYATNARRELDRHDLSAHTDKFRAGYYDDDDDDSEDAPSKPYTVNSDGVAVLYLSGPITKRPTSMSYYFGGTSSILMRRAVRQAAADPDVKAIALIIDSPGGQVNGTADLAADVAAAAEVKPVGAYAEDTCCSAAYWVGSQADFLYCNLTAAVGSIGTLLVIEDTSGAYAQEGVKVNVISTGPYKGAGTDGAPVTKSHLADFQREVDEINACFLQGVADGRDNLDMDQVQSLATGQVHIGQKAVDLGLADAVTSLDEFMESMAIQIQMQAERMDAPAATPNLPAGQQDPDGSSSGATAPTAETESFDAESFDAESFDAESFDSALTDLALTELTDLALTELTDLALTDALNPLAASIPPSLKETDTMPDEQQQLVPATVPAVPATASSARIASNNDILTACQAAGITNAKDLEDRLTMATLGDQYAEETRADAKVQAIRANGAEIGNQLASSCENLPIATVAAMRDGWKAEADQKFGISASGKAAERKSAPAAPRVSVPAEAGTDSTQAKTAWSKLTAEQQKQGMQMGMTTPEQREKFAAQYQEVKETSN